jgi:hypothetical protein
MLNIPVRGTVRHARALLLCLTVPWVWTWMGWAAASHAADSRLPATETSLPFEHYQAWRDETLQDWREANDQVGKIGGWRSYLREAQGAAETPERTEQIEHHPHGH